MIVGVVLLGLLAVGMVDDGRVVVPHGHANAGGHRCHALDRHDERHGECDQAADQEHGCILLRRFRHSRRGPLSQYRDGSTE